MPKRSWLYLRIAALSALFCWGLALPLPVHPDFLQPAPLSFLLVVAGAMAIGIVFIASILGTADRQGNEWKRPSWILNPLNIRQPLVFFDFVGFGILFYGMGSAGAGLISTPKNWGWEIPVSAACGVLIGVRLAMFVLRSRIEKGT